IIKQVSADGVNREQATEYHCFTLDLFLLAYLLARHVQQPFSKEYSARLHLMFKFLSAIITLPAGSVLQIGDSDNARVLHLDESNYSPYLARLNCGAVVFQDPELKVTTGKLDETTYWLLGGGEITAQFQALPQSRPDNTSRIISFPEGGYFVFQTVNDEGMPAKLIFDCGPLGYPPLCAHGHSDALAIWLIIDGEEILTDAGTYAYHTEREWRDYFRSTSAHNTIMVQGADQSVIGGPFLWLKPATCKLAKVGESRDAEVLYVAGTHDGYKRLSPPVIHTRAINWFKTKRIFTIRDELFVTGEIIVEELFHLAPCVEVELKNNNIVLLHKNKVFVAIKFADILQIEVVKGIEKPRIKGWYSRVLGKKEQVYTITAWGRISTPVEFITIITFARNAEDSMRILLS
ncbi:MAG: heparinase II/III-family protein, partial [Candidatus Sumerlaeia bacterium]|nr:heparinase II/III-family protein [Candidatus Sumerlaeia bacterium]